MASHRGQVLQKIRCGAGFILSDSQGLRAGVKERENGEGAFETAFEEPPPDPPGPFARLWRMIGRLGAQQPSGHGRDGVTDERFGEKSELGRCFEEI